MSEEESSHQFLHYIKTNRVHLNSMRGQVENQNIKP
jgi:hypothetical protein